MSDIITFHGTVKRDKISYLVFKVQRDTNERQVEIPVDDRIARHVMLYLERVAPPLSKPVASIQTPPAKKFAARIVREIPAIVRIVERFRENQGTGT